MPFFVAFAGFMGGVAFRSFFDLGLTFGITVLLLGGACSFFTTKEKQILFLTPLFLVAFGLGVVRYDLADIYASGEQEDIKIGEVHDVRALIVEEPVEREKSTRLVVRFFSGDKLLTPKVLITNDVFPRYTYGDEIALSGVVAEPKNFMSENGREVNYVAHLRKDGIYFTMLFPSVTHISSGNGSTIKSLLFSLKTVFLKKLNVFMPQPHAGLMGGLVLGTDESLPETLVADFRRVGLIHTIVLSGYNISIVAEAAMRLFSFASRRAAPLFGGIAVVLFAVMTGGHAAVVRASIMALLVLLARASGRRYDIVRALFLAALGMVCVNPELLVFDLSFQLSFLATFSLIVIAPLLEKVFQFVPNVLHIRESLIATVSTQIFVLPLLLYTMGQISLISIVANVAVLPAIPLAMLVGFLLSVLSFVSPVLALPLSYVATAILSYVIGAVRFFARIPFAVFSVPLFPWWAATLLYIAYGIILLVFWRKEKGNTLLV